MGKKARRVSKGKGQFMADSRVDTSTPANNPTTIQGELTSGGNNGSGAPTAIPDGPDAPSPSAPLAKGLGFSIGIGASTPRRVLKKKGKLVADSRVDTSTPSGTPTTSQGESTSGGDNGNGVPTPILGRAAPTSTTSPGGLGTTTMTTTPTIATTLNLFETPSSITTPGGRLFGTSSAFGRSPPVGSASPKTAARTTETASPFGYPLPSIPSGRIFGGDPTTKTFSFGVPSSGGVGGATTNASTLFETPAPVARTESLVPALSPSPIFGTCSSPFGNFPPPSPSSGIPADANSPSIFGTFSSGGFNATTNTPSPFGSPPPQAPTGSLVAAPSSSIFGSVTSSSEDFDAETRTSPFGSPPPVPSGCLFGSVTTSGTPFFGASLPISASSFDSGSTRTGGLAAPALKFETQVPGPTGQGLSFGAAPASTEGGMLVPLSGIPGLRGTKMIPFQVTPQEDFSCRIALQSISAMPAYESKSFEECRFEDYSQGNRGSGIFNARGNSYFGLGTPDGQFEAPSGKAAVPIDMHEELIFNFHDRRAVDCQSNTTCETLFQHLVSTLSGVTQEVAIPLTLLRIKSMFNIHFVAPYACAIIYSKVRVGTVSLTLVGLDAWKRKVHSSINGRENIAIANVSQPTILLLGQFPEENVEKLFKNMHDELIKSEKENKGTARRQSSNHKGNQKTPSFVYKILLELINPGNEPELPIQGGTTDVGLHTGCVLRNTSFPLVLSSLHTMLKFNGERGDEFFNKCIVLYYFQFLVHMASSLSSYIPWKINRAITVIREMEKWLDKIKDNDFRATVAASIAGYHGRLRRLAPPIDYEVDLVPQESVSTALRGLRRPKFPSIPDYRHHSDSGMPGINEKKNSDNFRLEKMEPYAIRVLFAGNAVVNGIYNRDGYFNGASKFSRQGEYQGENSVFSLFQCGTTSGTKFWYISFIPVNNEPGNTTDIDFYSAPVTQDCTQLPPQNGWTKKDKGLDPAPGLLFEPPVYATKPSKAAELERARQNAAKNLKMSSLSKTIAVTGKAQDAWVHLAMLNDYFWTIASKLKDSGSTYDISNLRSIVNIYEKDLVVARNAAAGNSHMMMVVLASNEVLAIWISFCWAHRVAQDKHDWFKTYTPTLDPEDLKYLVLDDARAIHALDCVRDYLLSRDHPRRSNVPFRKKSDTLMLAMEFGKKSPKLLEIYSKELHRANKLIETRHQSILQAQRKLATLDSELALAEKEAARAARSRKLAEKYEKVDNGYGRYRRFLIEDDEYLAAVSYEREWNGRVASIEQEIEELEERPYDLEFPLPRNQDIAFQWLFFIFMPEEFRDLVALAHVGQSKLRKEVPASQSGLRDLRHWFESERTVSGPLEPVAKIVLFSSSSKPSLATPNIRRYERETRVYFPDSLGPLPVWEDGDPFAQPLDPAETTVLFTEKLPNAPGSRFLQQFVVMRPSPTRGNEGIAQRESKGKPDWLLQEQFYQFSNLRAFPNMQIRQLVVALVDDLLPFENTCVHILVKQLLYHIGEPLWKVDLKPPYEGLARLMEELAHQADILCQSPAASNKLVLFGVMSAFLGQLGGSNSSCARTFARIARDWADDVEAEIRSFELPPPELYWKQAKFYGYVLLCHSIGERENQDYLDMAEAIVLFRTKKQFVSERPEFQLLDQPIAQVMANRIDGILRAVKSDLYHLTRCLSLVIDSLPRDLNWKPVLLDGAATGSFEAISDHLYSINLLNGIILVDGAPLGFLPHSVVDNPLYKITFGSRNFETVFLGIQHYRSARAVGEGILYEFSHSSDEQLHICEWEPQSEENSSNGNNDRLLLLRKELLDLPVLLRENHSHWYSPRHNAVILRGISYRERAISIVVTPTNTYVIPPQFQNSDLKSLFLNLESCDRLLLGKSRVAKVLSRIEKPEYIHVTVDAKCTALRFSLPRCKLAFEQNDKEVESKEFAGFSMTFNQRLTGTLIGVTSYIILRNPFGGEKVLVPFGDVSDQGNVALSSGWDCSLGYYVYNVHERFRNLVSSTCEGRLHLAAMYAASSSFLVDTRLSKTGSSVAADLVRQCWTNEPLTVQEREKLQAVSIHSRLFCTLRLVCSWIWLSSNSVRFLHSEELAPKLVVLELDVLAADEYQQSAHAPRLLACEERLLLGTEQPLPMTSPFNLLPAQFSRSTKHVESTEAYLRTLYVEREKPTQVDVQHSMPPLPFKKPPLACGLEEEMFDDLTLSWEAHKNLPLKDSRIDRNGWAGALNATRILREQAEACLLSSVSNAGADAAEYTVSLISGRLGVVSSIDFLCMAWDEGALAKFNPFLDSYSRQRLRLEIVQWMMLCVLEDKLGRLCQTQDKHEISKELDCVREWSPFQYPRWIAFEVEQQLQIRPYQYTIVQQLLKQPGSCTQLNMGLGKTRVLLPMLILELSRTKSSTVRVTALASIFHEAVDYFRSVLVASVQHVRVCTMPFHRDTVLDESIESVLTEQMIWCRENFGCLFVTPQHRNSLLLKQHDNGVFVSGLKNQFSDILDESDAILDPTFQLVYAIGTQEPLPDGPRRWTMIEALLAILAALNGNKISSLLSSFVKLEHAHFGSFPKLRLLEPFRQFEAEVGRELCLELLENPPHEFRWMREVSAKQRDVVVRMMSDPSFQIDEASREFSDDFLADILAARGCVANRTLFHALYSRYRVSYGLDVSSGRTMAVPYAASDTPKPRAQYSHPDMAIVYTCLSYYHEGITLGQFREALVCLQKLGSVAKEVIFNEWLDSIRVDADGDELTKFDNIQKVDTENKIQLCLMHRCFKRSMPVVTFWMNNFVFPDSTDQFSAHRSTSAWNLVDSCCAVGFSGTDDTRFLLPLDIKQVPPDDVKLRATNGSMIDRILACTEDVVILDDDEETPLWQEIVSHSLKLGMAALIDTAGLMAGSVNSEVATFIASLVTKAAFRGIVYYEPDGNSWDVYELENKRRLPLKSSSLAEAECFVYFDQSRCRGADMKLRKDAQAFVTLESNLRKDRFLQGCMRMRNLREGGQSLILAGTSEFVSCNMTANEVLEKIIHNTVRMVQQGVVTYLERGLGYYSFPEAKEQDNSLKHMYAKTINDHEDLRGFLDASYEVDQMSSSKQQKLVEYCKSIGQGVDAQLSTLAEECEQELQKEVEQDNEEEVQLPVENPYSEVDWDFEKAFSDPEFLFQGEKICFFPLKAWMKHCKMTTLSTIRWSDKLFCTSNFWYTTRRFRELQSMAHYMRPVNSMLTLNDGRVVLLSEYEADQLLPIWRQYATSPNRRATLQHLCMIVGGSIMTRRDYYNNNSSGFGMDNSVSLIDDNVLTSLKLFRGYVSFSPNECQILTEMFHHGSVQTTRSFLQNLLSIRGRLRFFDRSDLDDFSSPAVVVIDDTS